MLPPNHTIQQPQLLNITYVELKLLTKTFNLSIPSKREKIGRDNFSSKTNPRQRVVKHEDNLN